MTVLSVNPNPAIDRIAVVDFARGGTLKPIRTFEWPGGSGVHAAHVAQQLGARSEVLTIIGGDYGQRFVKLAQSHGLVVHSVENSAETRSTFTLLDVHDGNICDVAEYGGVADEGVAQELIRNFESLVRDSNVCVMSGSLLAGLPDHTYARMVEIANNMGVPTIVDATGQALLAVARTRVFLLKASLEELCRDGVMDAGVTAESVVNRASEWVASGVANVCVSLGSSGLLWVSSTGFALLAAESVKPYNTVGCGDAFVGAIAASVDSGATPADCLARGVAAATANLAYDAPGHCTLDDVNRLVQSVHWEIDNASATSRAIAHSRPK